MTQVFNIYCDESCHLEHDHQGAWYWALSGARLKRQEDRPTGIKATLDKAT
jgi:hypothetical protein